MAFGDFARLDGYDPSGTFPPNVPEDEARWAREAAAARLARGVARSDAGELGSTAQQISSGFLRGAQGLTSPVGTLVDASSARVGGEGPITEADAAAQNRVGEGVAQLGWALTPVKNPFGPLTQVEMRGGELFAGGRKRAPRPTYTTEAAPIDANPRATIGGNMPPPEAKFPQYAEQYPPVGPPAPAFDPEKQKAYFEKAATPETTAFLKEREKISKAMAKNGYTPMFDPAQRYHVDPSNYPANTDTLGIVPAKQETIDKHMEKIGSEASRERLRAAYERGTTIPNADNWYAMGQLEKAFVDELGPEEGRKQFQNRIATSMAATTGGADPRTNWLMAAYGNYLRTNNMPLPEASHQYPYPIGGRFAGSNMAMFDKLYNEGGWPALGEDNPKRHNFSQNFTGNKNVATMDEQMTSGMTPGVTVPPPGHYGMYEAVLADEAARMGVSPQEYQAVAWSGFKNMKDPKYTRGKPFIETINDSIERTSRLTGMSPQDVLSRGVIRGEIPLYALLGSVGAGAAAKQSFGSIADQSEYHQ